MLLCSFRQNGLLLVSVKTCTFLLSEHIPRLDIPISKVNINYIRFEEENLILFEYHVRHSCYIFLPLFRRKSNQTFLEHFYVANETGFQFHAEVDVQPALFGVVI